MNSIKYSEQGYRPLVHMVHAPAVLSIKHMDVSAEERANLFDQAILRAGGWDGRQETIEQVRAFWEPKGYELVFDAKDRDGHPYAMIRFKPMPEGWVYRPEDKAKVLEWICVLANGSKKPSDHTLVVEDCGQVGKTVFWEKDTGKVYVSPEGFHILLQDIENTTALVNASKDAAKKPLDNLCAQFADAGADMDAELKDAKVVSVRAGLGVIPGVPVAPAIYGDPASYKPLPENLFAGDGVKVTPAAQSNGVSLTDPDEILSALEDDEMHAELRDVVDRNVVDYDLDAFTTAVADVVAKGTAHWPHHGFEIIPVPAGDDEILKGFSWTVKVRLTANSQEHAEQLIAAGFKYEQVPQQKISGAVIAGLAITVEKAVRDWHDVAFNITDEEKRYGILADMLAFGALDVEQDQYMLDYTAAIAGAIIRNEWGEDLPSTFVARLHDVVARNKHKAAEIRGQAVKPQPVEIEAMMGQLSDQAKAALKQDAHDRELASALLAGVPLSDDQRKLVEDVKESTAVWLESSSDITDGKILKTMLGIHLVVDLTKRDDNFVRANMDLICKTVEEFLSEHTGAARFGDGEDFDVKFLIPVVYAFAGDSLRGDIANSQTALSSGKLEDCGLSTERMTTEVRAAIARWSIAQEGETNIITLRYTLARELVGEYAKIPQEVIPAAINYLYWAAISELSYRGMNVPQDLKMAMTMCLMAIRGRMGIKFKDNGDDAASDERFALPA